MSDIKTWVHERFSDAGPKIFFELGAHVGEDTEWLAAIPGVTLHAFEPDPRNQVAPRANVVINRCAVGDRCGRAELVFSEWTYSSSLRRPKNHLRKHPSVTFGGVTQVDVVTLDSYAQARGIGEIDFIWADVQGAEGDVIRGGRETLARTKYLYTEFSDEELYEGQVSLRELLAMLSDFRLVQNYETDVLLERVTGR